MEVSVSFIKGIDNMEKTIKKVNDSNADYLHVDQMDGIFVTEKNFLPSDIENWVGNKSKPLEVHLMVADPQKYINDYQKLNTKLIYVHYEIKEPLLPIINMIKDNHIKVGLAINPDTSVNDIKPLLNKVDSILVMSVNPGLGGQKFMNDALPKISELKKLRAYLNSNYTINVDGGINDLTAKLCYEAGCDRVVSGSFICMEKDLNQQINKIKA